jgi:elongation factor P
VITAAELREGMAVRIEGEVYRVLEVTAKAGGGQMGGVVKSKLRNVISQRFWEPHFRPDDRLEDVELTKQTMEFLYSDSDNAIFMHPETYDQVEVPLATLGDGAGLLQPGLKLPVEFYDGQPIHVDLPTLVEARVSETAPPMHAAEDSAWKEARLENGWEVKVPLFIAPGDVVRVDARTGRYLERVREKKRGA